MLEIILVATGGAFGALTRFLTTNIVKFYLYNSFYGTLFVNVIGSFLIGYLISLGYNKNIPEVILKYFLIIGFLGSFTTFSAFSYEVIELYLSKKFFLTTFYIIISVVLCIISALFGMYINKLWKKY